MGNTNAPLSERIASSYKRLSAASTNLNNASDELGESIATLDTALKSLNLGVSTWVEFAGNQDQDGSFWSRDIGYAKIGNKWGVAAPADVGSRSLRGLLQRRDLAVQ